MAAEGGGVGSLRSDASRKRRSLEADLRDSGLGQGAAAELRAAKAAAGSDVRLRLGDGEDSDPDDY